MADQKDDTFTASAFEIGLMNSIAAISMALKASPGFNDAALKKIAQHLIDCKVPLPFKGEAAEEAYAMPLRILVSDQAQVMQWLGQDEVKH